MTIDEIIQMWEQDGRTDATQIASTALDIPLLHSKYIGLYARERLRLKKLEQDNIRLRAHKRDWLLGEMSKDELDALGWKPYQRATPLKNQIDDMLTADEDCMKLAAQMAIQSEKTNVLDSIIKIINGRSFQLNVAMADIKFKNGVN